jgi:hypothetical protein
LAQVSFSLTGMARMEGITVEVEVVMVGELIRNQVVEKKIEA